VAYDVGIGGTIALFDGYQPAGALLNDTAVGADTAASAAIRSVSDKDVVNHFSFLTATIARLVLQTVSTPTA
jgi:hypothetical protein